MANGLRSRGRLCAVISGGLAWVVSLAAPALAQYPPGTNAQCAGVSDTSVVGGQTVSVSGDAPSGSRCFDANSSIDVFFIQSTTRIASARADANGNYHVSARISSNARPGAASIEVRGELGDGSRFYTASLSVGDGAGLPATGRDLAVMTAWGAALIVVGTLLVRLARRRRARARVSA